LPVDRERAVEAFCFCHVSAAAFLVQEPMHSHLTLHKAEAGLSGELRGKATVGNYSTVKSARRLRATLSIRPRGRVQIIDMFLGSILVS
jgi:hypothetical protein